VKSTAWSDAVHAATAFGDVEGVDAEAFVDLVCNLYMDNVGQTTQDSTTGLSDMLVDLDAPLMEHRMQQVMTSAALTDAAHAATAFGDVVEGADAMALAAMDNSGQTMQDTLMQKWQALVDGAITGGMLMSGGVECGTAISEVAAHGLSGGDMGLGLAVGGALASGFAARDHWQTRRSRLDKCEALDKDFVNSFPRDSHGEHSHHHAFISVHDEDRTFDQVVSQLSAIAKPPFDVGTERRIADRACVLENVVWDDDVCKEEDFRIRHFRYQVGPDSYVWFLPPATPLSNVEDYIGLWGLDFFENVFLTSGMKQKAPETSQVSLMAKLESRDVTTVFVKPASKGRDVAYYLGEKRKWSQLQINGKQFKASVVIVGDKDLKDLPGGEVLANLLTGRN